MKHLLKLVKLLFILCLSFSVVGTASADEITELKTLVTKLLGRVEELEKKVEHYESQNKENQTNVGRIEKHVDHVAEELNEVKTSAPEGIAEVLNGIDLGLGLTSVYQFTHNANGDDLSKNVEDGGDATWSLDLELSKNFDDYGSAFMLLEAGQGGGVDEKLKLFSPVNFDATGEDANVSLVEGWYEQYIEKTTLTFGKLDATIYIDTSEYANDEAGQFLGNMFRNNPTVQFPDNGAGLRLGQDFNEKIQLNALVMDGNGDWEDVFGGPFAAAQITVRPGLWDRGGNYRLYGWMSAQEHIKFSDVSSDKNMNHGFGLSADQELTDIAGIFVRFGHQNPKVFLNEGDGINLVNAYSVGLQFAGEPWGRDDDVTGIAFGQAFPSADYKDANSGFKADAESHIEAYYNYAVNPNLSISPLLHVVIDPYGGDAANGDKTIVIGGIRSQVDF